MPKLRFCLNDSTFFDVEITKASKIKISKKMLTIEERNSHMILNWTEGLLDEFSNLNRIEIIREGD